MEYLPGVMHRQQITDTAGPSSWAEADAYGRATDAPFRATQEVMLYGREVRMDTMTLTTSPTPIDCLKTDAWPWHVSWQGTKDPPTHHVYTTMLLRAQILRLLPKDKDAC
eukprot:gene12943-biopygen9749